LIAASCQLKASVPAELAASHWSEIVSGLLSVMTACTGMVTQSALLPIRRLAFAVRRIIDAGPTHERVPVSSHQDAINELTKLFNTMLDKIEDLVDGMREAPSWHAFARENGTVYHTYSVTAPDPFVAPYHAFLLARTPKEQPDEPRDFRKDEYPD
jgi:hypothetical protein